MASETRTIEKFGILKLLPEDRGANNLLVTSEVIQLPFSEFVNTKSNPFKGHYGYCCLMYGEYVVQLIDIQFRKQVILDRNQYVVQLAHQEFHNSKEIAGILSSLWPDTTVDYPIFNFTEVRFKLEPGVVLKVFKSSIGMVDAEPAGIKQSGITPPPPQVPGEPPRPPREDTNDALKIPLSPPYAGINDTGNTYVRGLEADGTPTDRTAGSTYVTVDIVAYTNPQVHNESVSFPLEIGTFQGYVEASEFTYICDRQATTAPAGTFCNLWHVDRGPLNVRQYEVSLVGPPAFKAVYTPPTTP